MTARQRPLARLLVVDLDDTLWTWFDAWHSSFNALLDSLVAETGLTREQLLPEIKKVHEQRGTAEYSWLVDELEILRPFAGGKKISESFNAGLHAQNSARKKNTLLYPGVEATLRYIKSRGVRIVAYTESLSFWTEWRVRLTGLDGVIDVLYSSPDHDFPSGETVETVRTLSAEEYGLRHTIHKHVGRGIAKPDPRILEEILVAEGVAPHEVVYVGDGLDRDVEMAQTVGVLDVHAKYGETFQKPGYDLLRQVTHWKPAAVEKESSTDAKIKAVPTYSLDRGFFQLIPLFQWGLPFNADAHLAIWKESVGVQMHFNDIGWRIRALALTVLTFTLGAIGFIYVNADPVSLVGIRSSPAVFLPLLGAGLWIAFWFADRGWFHKLLIGSVIEGADQEALLRANGIAVNLGAHITQQSPIRFFRKQSRAEKIARSPRVPRIVGGKALEWHSSLKLNIFYWIGLILLAATMLGIVLLGPKVPAPAGPIIVNNTWGVDPSPVPSPEPTSPHPTPPPSITP